MSGIAGVWHRDGRPIEPAGLSRLSASLGHRGPDGQHSWLERHVGMVHTMLHSTPESLRERQPFGARDGSIWLTFDGRIDNRDELWRELQKRGFAPRSATDAEFVLQAYQCWGTSSAEHLLGDFALAIWDERRGELYCARDVLGIRPFYYTLRPSKFVWASEPHAILRYLGETPPPNEGMVGEYLANRITDKHETLFEGLYRLPPAHALVVSRDVHRMWRYWDVDPAREIRYRNDDQYGEHLRALVFEAVRCRLRCHTPVGIMLSGGLDSSSVAGAAMALRAEGARPVESFSVMISGPVEESAYFGEVTRMWNMPANVITSDTRVPCACEEESARYRDIPNYPNSAPADALHARARAKGVRVLLTGLGGDEWLTGSRYHYADLLRQGRLVALARRLREDAPLEHFVGWRSALKMAVWPNVPTRLQGPIKRALRRGRSPEWIPQPFASRIGLQERLRRHELKVKFPSFAQYDIYHEAMSGYGTHALEMMDRSAAPFDLEYRHPLHDRRLVEFALALPEHLRWRDGQRKFLLRRAMAGLVPEVVRKRLVSPDFSHILVDALEAQGGAARLHSTMLGSLGWVSELIVSRMYGAMMGRFGRHDPAFAEHVRPLWMIFALDVWARQTLGRATSCL